MQKLTERREGERGRIVGIEGDRRYLSRITSIGLNNGCWLEMVQNVKWTCRGPIACRSIRMKRW